MKKPKIEIIYEDEAIVYVSKPSRFLSIPDRYAPNIPNLFHHLEKKYGKIFVVHRLDKETSGGLVFAKTEEAHKHLNLQFEKRTVQKVYTAIVDGHLHESEGSINKGIAPSPSQQKRMIISRKGKASLTHYKVVEQFKHFAQLAVEIKTGRTHQIRVHMESIGYPLMVDGIYGKRNEFFLSEIKHRKYRIGKDQEERPLLSRTALHASSLAFDHPISQERLQLECALPKDLSAVIKQLQKWNL